MGITLRGKIIFNSNWVRFPVEDQSALNFLLIYNQQETLLALTFHVTFQC